MNNRVFLVLIGLVLTGSVRAAECNPGITNNTCTITIDRESPSSPLTIRVKNSAVVIIHVIKRPTDKVGFDATFTDVATPDPINAILSAFLPGLKAVVAEAQTKDGTMKMFALGSNKADFTELKSPGVAALLKQLDWIQAQQNGVRKQLEKLKSDFDAAGKKVDDFQSISSGDWSSPKHVLPLELRNLDTALSPTADSVPPLGVVGALHEALTTVEKRFSVLEPDTTTTTQTDLDKLSRSLNEVAANQTLLETSVASFQAAQIALTQTLAALRKIDPTKALSKDQPYGPNTSKLGRSVAVKVSATDVISKTATALATVTVNWISTPWEVSAGVLFSNLVNRTFQATPIIANGQAKLDASGKGSSQITTSITRPSVIPVALAHYRLGEAAVGDRRVAFLLTGGLGVSPYSSSADFAAGATLSYRMLMVSPLLHFGRDLRLTNGLVLGQELGSSPPALSTERYWVKKFGIGITLRLPF